MSNLIDLTGQTFGHLVVLYRGVNNGRFVVWICQCGCSPDAKIPALGAALKSHQTTCCGCDYCTWRHLRAQGLSGQQMALAA